MSRILITGGCGFIGSHLAERLSGNNQVTVLDNHSTGHNQPEGVAILEGDINDPATASQVFSKGFDYVYHYAAVVGVERTLQDPIAVLKDIEGIKNVLEQSRLNNVQKVLFSSSSEVYGDPVEIPQSEETTPLNSKLPYAVVKNVGEVMLRSYQKAYGLNYTIFRFFNTYGPRQSADFVFSRFLKQALKGENITIYGDGKQTRTFCCVYDNIEATINGLTDETALNSTINIGSEIEVPIIDLAKRIKEISGSKSKIVHLPPLKEGDMPRRQPDTSKMKHLLGRDLLPLDKGIEMLIDYTKDYDDSLLIS